MMWLEWLSGAACAICVSASARRLSFVFRSPFADPEALCRGLRRISQLETQTPPSDLPPASDGAAEASERTSDPAPDRLEAARRSLDTVFPEGSFEHTLLRARALPFDARDSEVAMGLLDLQYDLARWARVPRVAASLATSVCFLGAAAALRQGLLEDEQPNFEAATWRAVGIVAMGLATGLACMLLQRAAAREARRRLRAVDDLVPLLTGLTGFMEAAEPPRSVRPG
jgi:hypothetical protein